MAKEIKYGSEVSVKVKVDNNITIHELKNSQTGEELCNICAEWTEK
jgi:hypothetical protein